MKDPYGRSIYNLRISVTRECSFDCFFCHHEGLWKESRVNNEYLSPREIKTTVKTLTKLGIREIKITGGEPLQREGILKIIREIASIKEVKEVSMTSNGFFLEEYASELKNVGLDRINVSLNSLYPDVFTEITHTSAKTLERVISGIKKARKEGLDPVKINFVALKDINVKEIPSIITFAKENNLHLHLIEYHAPNKEGEIYKKHFYPLKGLEGKLTDEAREVRIRKLHHRKQVIFPGGMVAEFIRPMTNPEFCKNCHRIRITALGEFKPCLMRTNNHVDFSDAFESEKPKQFIRKKFRKAVNLREPYFS